jgi:hypothetical protein
MMTGSLKIMNRTGHTKVEWSTDLQETVDAANRRFNDLLAQGYTAFTMTDVTTGEKIADFDQEASSILMVPRMVGG